MRQIPYLRVGDFALHKVYFVAIKISIYDSHNCTDNKCFYGDAVIS